MVDLAIQRLRTPGTRTAAESLLRRAVPDAVDRSVLIVRRITVDAADPAATREQLAGLRRTAARPHPGTLRLPGGTADAVLFSDEAQLLACLILDLVTGLAAQRWYWRPRLAARNGGRPLVSVMVAQARWLGVALDLVEAHAPPGLLAEAIATLTPAERATVRAAIALTGGRLPPVLAEPRAPAPSAAELLPGLGAVAAPLRPQPRRRSALPTAAPVGTAPPTPEPPSPRPPGIPYPAVPPGGRPEAPAPPWAALAAAAGTGGPPVPDADSPAAEGPDRAATPGADRRPAPTDVDRRAAEPGVSAVPTVAPVDPTREEAGRAAGSPSPPARRARPPYRRPSLTEGAATIRTNHAGVLYLLPLMLRLGPEDGLATPSWIGLARFGRRVLRRGLGARRRAADPLWPLLHSLETDETAARPSGPPPWWREACDYLARSGIEASALVVPGTVALTRTHLDVILRLEQIDLRIRRAGLDADPGWVPVLGRIVSFHFL